MHTNTQPRENKTAATPDNRRFLTVKQTAEENPAFTVPALRQLIFEAKTNGLAESGAITRIGRRILIEQSKFFDWIEKGAK